eukprot:1631526-Amphidinium_carterae.1
MEDGIMRSLKRLHVEPTNNLAYTPKSCREHFTEKSLEVTLQHCPSTEYFQIDQNYSMKSSGN